MHPLCTRPPLVISGQLRDDTHSRSRRRSGLRSLRRAHSARRARLKIGGGAGGLLSSALNLESRPPFAVRTSVGLACRAGSEGVCARSAIKETPYFERTSRTRLLAPLVSSLRLRLR